MTIQKFSDRVLQTSTTTGTGNLTLASPPTGYRAFSSEYTSGQVIPYVIEGVGSDGLLTGQWEVGEGTLSGGAFVRSTVHRSSNGNSLVNFSSASLRVFSSPTAQTLTGGIGAAGSVPRWSNANLFVPGQIYDDGTNVGIGAAATTAKLQVAGSFSATTKSFDIEHQAIPGGRLLHGVLEGPEHAVYVRGKLEDGRRRIALPEYWSWLVDEKSITVHLTGIRTRATFFVVDVNKHEVIVDCDSAYADCYYEVRATRVDVPALVVEVTP